MKEKRTFVVHIMNQENATWQGQVTWLDENITTSFRSMLELIKLMDTAMEGKHQIKLGYQIKKMAQQNKTAKKPGNGQE